MHMHNTCVCRDNEISCLNENEELQNKINILYK